MSTSDSVLMLDIQMKQASSLERDADLLQPDIPWDLVDPYPMNRWDMEPKTDRIHRMLATGAHLRKRVAPTAVGMVLK